jgi:two-component system phosphate regulon sensor histidine kinase PhoR
MLWRLFTFISSQLVAAAIGWWLTLEGDAEAGMLLGALLVGYVWLMVDMLRGARMLRWLRSGIESDANLGGGIWGEASDRIRRLIRARDKLASQSESRLHDFLAALQESPNGVILLDEQGRIEWCNHTASVHFCLDVHRDMMQHLGNLVRDPAFAAYFSSGDFRGEVTMPGRQSTTSKPVKLAVHLHPYGDGRNLLLSRDITALEQADAMRRDFVANVSHEIRTPLTVLAGFVETMQSLPLTEEERDRYLMLMAQQATRMQTLVSDLLTLSRLEGSSPPSLTEWVDIDALMVQCEQDGQDLSRLLWQQPHDLHFKSQGVNAIAGASSELYSALFNLVSNAIRYTQVQQRIEVVFRLFPNGAAEMSVQDTGLGIAPEHIPRLTERFYRVDTSRSRETGGTGLGLAIVKHVAQRHGAELKIDSVPGKGSKFSIIFPSQRVQPIPIVKKQ